MNKTRGQLMARIRHLLLRSQNWSYSRLLFKQRFAIRNPECPMYSQLGASGGVTCKTAIYFAMILKLHDPRAGIDMTIS